MTDQQRGDRTEQSGHQHHYRGHGVVGHGSGVMRAPRSYDLSATVGILGQHRPLYRRMVALSGTRPGDQDRVDQ